MVKNIITIVNPIRTMTSREALLLIADQLIDLNKKMEDLIKTVRYR